MTTVMTVSLWLATRTSDYLLNSVEYNNTDILIDVALTKTLVYKLYQSVDSGMQFLDVQNANVVDHTTASRTTDIIIYIIV